MKKYFLFIAVLLVAVCVTTLTLLPADATGEIIAEGTCGDNLTWTLDDIGLLTISGTGAMYNYPYESPWYRYSAGIVAVQIKSGVTSIGDYAFFYHSSITRITIPDSVSKIGEYAFCGCSSLASITIPDSVSKIGEYAFYGCSSLTAITIPEGVPSIGTCAFRDCSSLTSITIPDSVTSIGAFAFMNCNSLTAVYITDIEAWCSFQFDYDSSNPLHYGATLYLNGEPVTDLVIPECVTSIGQYAFYGCSSLTSITIPEGVTGIGKYAFRNCSNITSINIPDSVARIEYDAFEGCSNLAAVYITEMENWLNIYIESGKANPLCQGATLHLNGEPVTDLVIPERVTYIFPFSFYGCSSITSVTMQRCVTRIYYSAFAHCSSLTSVTIPNSVTSIGDYAFSGCSSLTSVNIPDSVTSISKATFSGCSSLTSVTIPDSVTSIGTSAFYGCSSLTSVNIPDSVTGIDQFAFSGCSSLISVAVPEGVFRVEDYAFEDCSSLTSVTISENVIGIGDSAFRNCDNLWHVLYGGTEEQWFKITIGSLNSKLTSAMRHYKCNGEEEVDSVNKICSVCVSNCTHVWDSGVVTKVETCAEAGEKLFTCSLCNDKQTEVIPASGHSYEAVITAPTCTEGGYTTYTCATCGDIYTDNFVDALGHDYVSAVTAPTLEAGGFTTHTCTRCGDSYVDSYTDPLVPETDVKVIIGTVTGMAGDTLEVYLTLENAPELKILAISDLVYDTEHLTLISGEWLPEGSMLSSWNPVTLKGVHAFGENTDLNGDVFKLTFTINEDAPAGVYEIRCKVTAKQRLENGSEVEVPMVTESGAVEVIEYTPGDVDSNEFVTTDDAIYLLYHIMFGEEDYAVNQNCDFDGNGFVTTDDAIYLLYHIMFGETDYPLH